MMPLNPSKAVEWIKGTKKLFIDGQWCEGSQTFPTINPATEAVLTQVALAKSEEVDAAVRGARKTFDSGEWALLSLSERAEVLRRLGDLILENQETLAVLESLDTGKPISESFNGDIPRAAANFHFFADFAENEPKVTYKNPKESHYAVREPSGVVALITPWNLPLYLETWKLAPALMMGNSCVLKPSELTPLTSIFLGELIAKAGIPPGVVQVIQGFGDASTGEFLVSHPEIDAVSFTGETGTGRAIMKSASHGPTRVSFELGGKGASVIFESANLEKAVQETVRAAFRNQGEICLACPRIFVEASRYKTFLEKFLEKINEIVVGDPLDPKTTMGALISKEHYQKVTGYLNDASSHILVGGKRPENLRKGFYLSPTVITDIGLDHRISKEEVFGPVVSIYSFSSEEEVVRAVNDTPYGLSASIYSQDPSQIERVSRAIKMGLVWVNCWFVRDLRVPFGGQKKSGVGREGGRHSLDFFSEWKSICIQQ